MQGGAHVIDSDFMMISAHFDTDTPPMPLKDPLFGYCMQWVEAAKRMLGNGCEYMHVCMHACHLLYFIGPPLAGSALATSQRLDIVLFGGAMGSLFAMLQFLVSPVIGRLSDRVGRKRMLLWTMVGAMS